MSRGSDNQRILEHLIRYGNITQREALELYGCMRLASRIFDLRCAGYKIRTEFAYGKDRFGEPSRFAKYYLEELK